MLGQPLDHIAKASVLSSPFQRDSCAVTKQVGEPRKKPSGLTRGREEGREEGKRLRAVASLPYCLSPSQANIAKDPECQLTAHKHSTPAQCPAPRRLSLHNSCVIAGALPGLLGWCRGAVEWERGQFISWTQRARCYGGVDVTILITQWLY